MTPVKMTGVGGRCRTTLVLRSLKVEDFPWGVFNFLKPLRTFHGRSSTFCLGHVGLDTPPVECVVLVYQRLQLEPQSGTSLLRRGQSTTPSGSPSARGRGSPGQIFARPFASSYGRGGALDKFSSSPFCEINKKLVWRLGEDGIPLAPGFEGGRPDPPPGNL